MPRQKQAVVSEAMEDDAAMTPEDEALLKAQETDETPIELPEKPGEKAEAKPEPKEHEESIPYDRFKEVNERAKQLEQQAKENAEYRERWARLEERQRLAKETSDAARAEQERAIAAALEPDKDLDPVGYRAWAAEREARALRAEFDQFRLVIQQQGQQNQQDRANQDMNNWLAFQVPQARATVADYDVRVDYAREQRTKWWSREFVMPNGQRQQLFPPEVAANITANEEMVLLNRAKQLGIPIHMVVSALSDTWGYKPANGANGAVRQAATPQVLPPANQRLEQIRKGQAVTGQGQRPSGDANAQANWQTMDNDELKLYVNSLGDDAYLDMLQDPRLGKAFARRVEEMQLEG